LGEFVLQNSSTSSSVGAGDAGLRSRYLATFWETNWLDLGKILHPQSQSLSYGYEHKYCKYLLSTQKLILSVFDNYVILTNAFQLKVNTLGTVLCL